MVRHRKWLGSVTMTDRLPYHEWRTIMLESNEARLFRNMAQSEYEDGAITLRKLEDTLGWAVELWQ